MKAYLTYKTTDIEWLGDIPKHWEVKRLKQIVSTKITDGPHTTPDFVDEGVPFISAKSINHNRINFENLRGYITEELDKEYSKKVKPQRNDIFIVKSGATTGRIACVETDLNFNIWSPLALVRSNPNRAFYKYIFFQLQSHVFKTQIEIGWSFGTQENIGMGILECLFLAIPPVEEQTAIANYLDEKTSKLDLLISNKKAQIKQLKEIRQIEINTAVTKGLDPKVKLKSSGDVWLGDVPVHWRVRRLKEMTSRIGDGIHSTPNYVNNSNYFFVNGNNLINKTITINDSTNCVSEEEFKSYNLKLEPKTILLSINGTIGNLAFYKGESVVFGKSIAYMQCFDLYNEVYIHYFLQSSFVQTMFELSYAGTTIKNLSLNTIRNTKIAFPKEISEQLLIAEYLNNKTSKIDQLVSNLENQINQLQEIRKIEIYNAVTGKIKA